MVFGVVERPRGIHVCATRPDQVEASKVSHIWRAREKSLDTPEYLDPCKKLHLTSSNFTRQYVRFPLWITCG